MDVKEHEMEAALGYLEMEIGRRLYDYDYTDEEVRRIEVIRSSSREKERLAEEERFASKASAQQLPLRRRSSRPNSVRADAAGKKSGQQQKRRGEKARILSKRRSRWDQAAET